MNCVRRFCVRTKVFRYLATFSVDAGRVSRLFSLVRKVVTMRSRFAYAAEVTAAGSFSGAFTLNSSAEWGCVAATFK